jgi:organic radical activating enzyme
MDMATNVTLIFSNKCQLMCAYCDPSVSSMWEDTSNRFVKFKGEFTSVYKLHNMDRLKELINIDELRTLIISGGEPMLGKDCVQFLQELSPSTYRTILIITNLSYGNETMNALLSILNRHSNTSIAASLDSLGHNISRKYFEFLVYNMVERKKININIHIVVIITVSILNYANIQAVIEYIISFRKQGITDIRFNINPLREGTLCSLPSSELDSTKCVNLSESDITYLTPREVSMVENFNTLIRNNKRNAMLEKDTKEFLLEYMK